MQWESQNQLVCFERFFAYLERLAKHGLTDKQIKELEILCQHGSERARLRGQAIQDFIDDKQEQDPLVILDPETERTYWITNVLLAPFRTHLTFILGEPLKGQPWADIAQKSLERGHQANEE